MTHPKILLRQASVTIFAALLPCLGGHAQERCQAFNLETLPKREVRAVWLTTLSNLDWPKGYATTQEGIERQKRQLTEILDRYAEANINTVLFQARVRATTTYPSALEPLREVLPFVAFVMAAFSALRLAKFNLDERQSLGFIGLPTPANALFWGSLMVGVAPHFESSPLWAVAMVVGVLVSSYLLVSEIPMFALKFKQWGWKGNEVKYLFVLSCIPILALLRISGIAVIIAWYVLLSAMVAKKPAPQNH